MISFFTCEYVRRAARIWIKDVDREYWMIYREPGVSAVVRFGSSIPPPLHPSPSVFLFVASWAYWRERGQGRSQIIRPWASLILYESFNTLWIGLRVQWIWYPWSQNNKCQWQGSRFCIRGLLLPLNNCMMRSSLVVRASDCQCTSCNGPGFDPSIRRHSGIWGAADEAVLNNVWTKRKNPPKKYLKKKKIIVCINCVQYSQINIGFMNRSSAFRSFTSLKLQIR